jgi:Enoyl-CoA hydratase/carnithine racemase
MELVRKIIKNAPLAVGAAKVAVNLGSEMPIDEGTEYQLKENLLLFYTDDLKEGIRAFFYEKRQPKFQGK